MDSEFQRIQAPISYLQEFRIDGCRVSENSTRQAFYSATVVENTCQKDYVYLEYD
jgi:hypothetical protein